MRGKLGFLAQPSADTIKDETGKGTRSSQAKIIHPKNELTHGNGGRETGQQRRRSHCPQPITHRTSEQAAAKADRRALLLAIADAAIGQYATNVRDA